jgi:hypothetical protein
MLHLNINALNSCDVTVSNESELNNPNYLWVLTNLETKDKKYFIPFNATVPHAGRYDTFTFTSYPLNPEVLTGSTCNIHLQQGQYRYTIYDQVSSTNLDPLLSNSMVETGLGIVPQEEICFTEYIDDNPFSEAVVYNDPTCFISYISPNDEAIMVVYYDPGICRDPLVWNEANVNWQYANFNWEDPYPIYN